MPSADAVARYFLWLAASEPEDEPVTHMRLHKLLYYAQGWSLATRNEPLFEGTMEAWQHGPVVRQLYPRFANWGGQPIPRSEADENPELSADHKRLIEWVWSGYGKFSAKHLRDMTHGEPPWRLARAGLPDAAPSRVEIGIEPMREYFRGLQSAACGRLGIDAADLAASCDEARAGNGTPLTLRRRGNSEHVAH